jgi:hypothetical protein
MTERVNYRAALALMRQKFKHPREVIKALGLDAALEDCENNSGGRTPDRDSPLGRGVNLQNGEPKGNQLVGDQPHGQENVQTQLDTVRGIDPDRDIPCELVQVRDYLKKLRPQELQDPKLIAYLRTNYSPDELNDLMSLGSVN